MLNITGVFNSNGGFKISTVSIKIKYFLLDFVRIVGVLAIIIAFSGIIYGMYGEQPAKESAWLLTMILVGSVALACALELLGNARAEATDAIHNLRSTWAILKHSCGAALLIYYSPSLIWGSTLDLYALEDGNIFAIASLLVLTGVVILLLKKTKAPLP